MRCDKGLCVRIPATARHSGSEVRLVVSTFITLIQYVYINRSSTDGRLTSNGLSKAHEQMRNDKTSFQGDYCNIKNCSKCFWYDIIQATRFMLYENIPKNTKMR